MRFAYADPPYIGVASKFYGIRNRRVGIAEQHDQAAEYNDPMAHCSLLYRLHVEYPDGWAMSCSQKSLSVLLPVIPKGWRIRVGIWCKTYVQIIKGVSPSFGWEPVIICGGRKRKDKHTPRDWVVTPGPTVRGKTFTGSKPDEFCWWLFEVLNMQPGDELDDLFPGSGRVGRAWERWRDSKMALFNAKEAM